LRPKWIIDALVELLYEAEALRKQAIISVKDVRDIWKGAEYRGMHGKLLRLMKNFEMCYEIVGDTPQYIVPQLLPAADATKVVC
jgi:internalin A